MKRKKFKRKKKKKILIKKSKRIKNIKILKKDEKDYITKKKYEIRVQEDGLKYEKNK